MTALDAKLLSQQADAAITAANLLDRLDLERLEISNRLEADPRKRATLGQFFTPASVARFMADMLCLPKPSKDLRILDAGGGSGVLTAAAVAALCGRDQCERPSAVHATVWEIDEQLTDDLVRTFEHCGAVCQEAGVCFKGELRQENFILAAADQLKGALFAPRDPRYHVAIMNPPYRKLRSDSAERARLRGAGIETSNLYSAFVWLALELLEDGGELVAITPRSFMNGSYFRPFREALSRKLAFRRVHVYDARDVAFAGDDVLQENVIFHGVRAGTRGKVKITTSLGPADTGLAERTIDPAELILPDDSQYVLHVVPDETDACIARRMRALPHSLMELGITVSTGRVVGFRAKERLRAEAGAGDVPLILSRHFTDGFVAWPKIADSKPNALAVTGPDDNLLLPRGWYVLVNRFSAKEEKRRVVAALYDPSRIDAQHVAFDNKVNVLHCENSGLAEDLAKGLAVFLNSTLVDAYFRQFSGHTQVNAGDLRALLFPERETLEHLGRRIGGAMPTQDQIDELVREEIPAMSEGADPVRVKRRVQAAEGILPDDQVLELTAGGQNVLVKEIVERFAPRFTPGGHVIYVGDAGKKHLLYDVDYLKRLGVEIDPHGKMPDVVIHYVERDWLILIEAVTSHGPVNALRHNQLKDLFEGSSAGLVFVTTFLDRAAMREYLPEIAWETEVWVADAPGHLIHFNGERFLGPYPQPGNQED